MFGLWSAVGITSTCVVGIFPWRKFANSTWITLIDRLIDWNISESGSRSFLFNLRGKIDISLHYKKKYHFLKLLRRNEFIFRYCSAWDFPVPAVIHLPTVRATLWSCICVIFSSGLFPVARERYGWKTGAKGEKLSVTLPETPEGFVANTGPRNGQSEKSPSGASQGSPRTETGWFPWYFELIRVSPAVFSSIPFNYGILLWGKKAVTVFERICKTEEANSPRRRLIDWLFRELPYQSIDGLIGLDFPKIVDQSINR